MSFDPPFNLDPYEAIRNPGGLPVLMQRGIYDVMKKLEQKDGNLHSRFIKAFNVIATTLTNSGRLHQGTLKETDIGIARNKEVERLPDTGEKQRWLVTWSKQLKSRYPGRYDVSWWNDPYRGVIAPPLGATGG